MIDSEMCDYNGDPYLCAECMAPFNEREWHERHSDIDGADIHDYCCKMCGMGNVAHRVEHRAGKTVSVLGGIDYIDLLHQKQSLGNFLTRNFNKVHLNEMVADDLCLTGILPSEYDAMEGIDNLLDAIYELFQPVEHIEEI
jgi:hypothetical protein